MKGNNVPLSKTERVWIAIARINLRQHAHNLYVARETEDPIQMAHAFAGARKQWLRIWRHIRCEYCFAKSSRSDKLALFIRHDEEPTLTEILCHISCAPKVNAEIKMSFETHKETANVAQ